MKQVNFVNQGLAGIGLGLMLSGAMLVPAHAQPAGATINYGDDSSEWANDGECDDPRFEGVGAASLLLDADLRRDATDCRAAMAKGSVTFVDAQPGAARAEVNFGDDSGDWAKDGECDDPRFRGPGSAAELIDADLFKDASDCRAAYEAGRVTLVEENAATDAVDYGDDRSEWANDGECDDPRFSGAKVAETLLDSDIGRDATDCRAAVAAGASFDGRSVNEGRYGTIVEFDYGSDSSKWANDGQCDDLRFRGPGTDKKLLADDIYADATDCQTLEAAGQVEIRPVYTPAYAAKAPYDSTGIEFGDNSSAYAQDGQCDDPRFEGPGAAYVMVEDDLKGDADDCKEAYEAGQISLVGAD